MLLHSHIHDGIDCKQRDYGFVLALVCMLWLALAVAGGVMSKGGTARVISNESWGDFAWKNTIKAATTEQVAKDTLAATGDTGPR